MGVKLNDSRSPSSCEAAKARVVEARYQSHEIGVIQGVEGIGSELQTDPFADCEVLAQRKIEADVSRSANRPLPNVAGPESRSGARAERHSGKRGRVQVLERFAGVT